MGSSPRSRREQLRATARDRQGGDAAERARGGSSATAAAFGAQVTTASAEGMSLFFLVGREQAPDAVVRAAGGRVVTRLPDPRRVIALLPLSAYATIVGHRDLAAAGPVAIDPARFAAFARLVALDDEPPAAARPPP